MYEGIDNMDNINLMEYWLKSSDEDYNVMNFLYKGKKNSYSLFFGHLVLLIEK